MGVIGRLNGNVAMETFWMFEVESREQKRVSAVSGTAWAVEGQNVRCELLARAAWPRTKVCGWARVYYRIIRGNSRTCKS